ncbi:hypothetical protein LTR08_006163 [Meristemomyces frigidus]|nr:hypothetical protein LTR08_006163 [Meristemomyces frigidus]
MGSIPRNSSPLPPLPAYFPEKYRQMSAMHKAVHPPKTSRPYSLGRTQSARSLRMVPPSPALSTANLAAFNRSTESLSSVYSRSVSGEEKTPRPAALSESSRTLSSGSATTIVKSPLGAMRRAADPDTILMPGERSNTPSMSSDSEIDDAAMLQAKLPSVKAVSAFGEVATWQRRDHASYCAPLAIRKTRHSAAMPQRYTVQMMV